MAEPAQAAPPDPAAALKLQAQAKKLSEANAKYKNLLKLAKERIQQQEESLKELQQDKESLEERLASAEKENAATAVQDEAGERSDSETNIVRVCQRLKVASGDVDEIWALLEFESVPSEMAMMDVQPAQRYKEWKRFDAEAQLEDFIRRDTGEPLTLPSYSLSPEQSAKVQDEARKEVAKVTEDFRRFRIRAELARKQADAQIRDLQNNKVQKAAQRIEGHDTHKSLEQSRSASNEVERLKSEMAGQEAHWKEAYNMLLAENNALKSSGSEALLASQWRQRYEVCQKEKEDLEARLQSAKTGSSDADKYEAKYRDLKESFRLYRKKAKEIFESQQTGDGNGGPPLQPGLTISASSSADNKLAYLKSLMLNYLTADATVKDHMEGAIGTVLRFTPEEIAQVEKKKAELNSWF